MRQHGKKAYAAIGQCNAVTTCRCTATKHATSALPRLERSVREEIGWGEEFNLARFNRFMDGYRTIFYLRRGLELSGYDSISALHASEIAEALPLDGFLSLSDIDAAVVLFRARMTGKLVVPAERY